MATIACENCGWCSIRRDGPTCDHPQSTQTLPNWFTGGNMSVQMSLDSMRSIGPCGPTATLFKPLVGAMTMDT